MVTRMRPSSVSGVEPNRISGTTTARTASTSTGADRRSISTLLLCDRNQVGPQPAEAAALKNFGPSRCIARNTLTRSNFRAMLRGGGVVMAGIREQKKQATRQVLSDVAT